jgi:hypothetical protein
MKRTSKEVRQSIAAILKRSTHITQPQDPANLARHLRRIDEFVEEPFLGLSFDLGDDWTTWGSTCTLSISEGCEPSISWSSASRSPASARVAVKLYADVCDLADQIQAILDCTTVTDDKK